MQGKKPLNIAIGRRIQQSREQAGLTQEELAERIDRSTQFISTIERGLAGLSPAQLLLVDRMTSDLIKLLQMKESGDE